MGIVVGHGRLSRGIGLLRELFKKRSGPREERCGSVRAPTDERPYNRHTEFPEDHT